MRARCVLPVSACPPHFGMHLQQATGQLLLLAAPRQTCMKHRYCKLSPQCTVMEAGSKCVCTADVTSISMSGLCRGCCSSVVPAKVIPPAKIRYRGSTASDDVVPPSAQAGIFASLALRIALGLPLPSRLLSVRRAGVRSAPSFGRARPQARAVAAFAAHKQRTAT